jgi:hypothetical protein
MGKFPEQEQRSRDYFKRFSAYRGVESRDELGAVFEHEEGCVTMGVLQFLSWHDQISVELISDFHSLYIESLFGSSRERASKNKICTFSNWLFASWVLENSSVQLFDS